MRKIILCVLAVMLWSQAVDALKCYNCRGGGRCISTATCSDRQDRCMTIFFEAVGYQPPRYAKRCGSLYECQVLNSVPRSGVSAVCCEYDRCNR
ncbi:CD59B glycoprotein-like [Protobothrops mucrosquamatus]|uniref:CD59B glycoprotein-like n=1 Tax=Protobothrops mucrosquamatus TaxID=103944 RepID=UPI000775FC4A|nr:CD59B glycoprotein-like [Protobothrops mucrosquamatus]